MKLWLSKICKNYWKSLKVLLGTGGKNSNYIKNKQMALIILGKTVIWERVWNHSILLDLVINNIYIVIWCKYWLLTNPVFDICLRSWG